MQWLQKLFRKKNSCKGIVGISFLPQGIAMAVSTYTEHHPLKLIQCEFVYTKNTQEHFAILKNWVDAYNLGNYHCHLVLSIDDYRRINIDAPPVPEEEIALAVRWKINDLIDFSIDDAVIDYYPVPALSDNDKTLEVIASPNSIINPLVEQCTQAGLLVKVIDIQETTLRNLAALLPQNERGIAVLYLQKDFGIILIQKSGVIYVARQITIGYEKLNLLNKFATESHDNLALEIQRSLDYVESYYRIGPISAVAVIPWESNSQRLVDDLNNSYGINAFLMDLTALIHCEIALDDATQSFCALVIGATLRHTLPQHDSTTS